LIKPDFSFRGTFFYQSTMFTAAGLAVAATARTPWEEFIQKRILDPLDMKGTNFTTTAAEGTADRASAHRKNRLGETEVVPWCPREDPDPAGSMNTTARDMGQWLRFPLGDGTFGRDRLVSAAALAETHSPQMVIPLTASARGLSPETNQMN